MPSPHLHVVARTGCARVRIRIVLSRFVAALFVYHSEKEGTIFIGLEDGQHFVLYIRIVQIELLGEFVEEQHAADWACRLLQAIPDTIKDYAYMIYMGRTRSLGWGWTSSTPVTTYACKVLERPRQRVITGEQRPQEPRRILCDAHPTRKDAYTLTHCRHALSDARNDETIDHTRAVSEATLELYIVQLTAAQPTKQSGGTAQHCGDVTKNWDWPYQCPD